MFLYQFGLKGGEHYGIYQWQTVFIRQYLWNDNGKSGNWKENDAITVNKTLMVKNK
jgi:hypothetical protein